MMLYDLIERNRYYLHLCAGYIIAVVISIVRDSKFTYFSLAGFVLGTIIILAIDNLWHEFKKGGKHVTKKRI